jgi:putative transposase
MKLPAHSLNLNAYTEGLVRSIQESCLERIILFAKASLGRSVREFLIDCHWERNHQGLDNRLIMPGITHTSNGRPIHRRQRLGGMLNYYYRQAA